MLRIIVPGGEYYDEKNECFVYSKDTELQMEHSLISVSKWEARWHKAYNTKRPKTSEEILDYFKCMTINRVDPEVYDRLTSENIREILEYINDSMTAVYFPENEESGTRRGDTLTSEVLYYYMITLGIPFECEKWHLNKLFSLMEVCSMKMQPNKKLSKSQIWKRNAKLNAARRQAANSKG